MSARPRRIIPRSLLWLLLFPASIAVGTSLPLIGVLLYFLSPVLVPLVLLLTLVSLAIEAGAGRVARIWLLAPGLWFGGYAAIYGVGVYNIRSIASRLDVENAKQSVAFDPATQALAMGKGFGASSLHQFMKTFDVAVIYEPISEHAGAGGPRYFGTRFADVALCRSITENDRLYSEMQITGTFERDDDTCLVRRPETPDRPLTQISTTWTNSPYWGVIGSIGHIKIASDAAAADLTLADVTHIAPFPVLLFDAVSRAGVVAVLPAGPSRTYGLLGKSEELSLAARTLGLARRAQGVAPTPTAPPLPTEGEWRRAQIAELERKLDAFLTTPELRLDRDAVDALRRHPDLIAARASALVQAALEPHGRSHAEFEHQNQAYDFVAELSDVDFRPFAPRFLASFKASLSPEKTGVGSRFPAHSRVLARLGVLGPDAIQFLVDVYFDNPKARFNALIGLCRAGAPAAGAMEDIIGRLADLPDLYETSPSRRRLLAIAALRVGRPDLAQTIDEMSRRNLTSSQTEFPDPAPEEWPGDYAKIVATVSKESAPAVCDVKMNKWYD